jgi:hypothetical protein
MMNDPNIPDEDTPEDFDEHVEYLGGLVVEATEDDHDLRARIFFAIEQLVTNVDGGRWEGCRVSWTDDIPDTLAGIDGIEDEGEL